MKTSFNSQSVRNEIFNIESENLTVNQMNTKKLDKGLIGFIGFVVAMVATIVVLNQLGLINNY